MLKRPGARRPRRDRRSHGRIDDYPLNEAEQKAQREDLGLSPEIWRWLGLFPIALDAIPILRPPGPDLEAQSTRRPGHVALGISVTPCRVRRPH